MSSTFEDLHECRDQIRLALKRLGVEDVAMEYYTAESERPLDRCLRDVMACDLYLGVFAWRYGYIPPGKEQSITELEYRAAVASGKPTLIFVLKAEASWPRTLMDKDATRIESLRDELCHDVLCSLFSTPQELAALVPVAVHNQLRTHSTPHAPVTAAGTSASVSGMSLMPLATAVKDPRPVFTAADVGAFTGREWLAAEVDEFIAGHPCGYVFIEAEAGLGKTAFAAWLVKTRGYLSHFSRYSGGGSVQGALANLSAQLITHLALDDQAPGGMLPQWAQTPGGFESLLATAADRAHEQGRSIVLVVDGLDEAETPAGGLPFGLPSLLPDGVYVVATYRTGRAPGRPDAPFWTVPIAKNDQRNQGDVRAYLIKATHQDVIAARLADAGMDAEQFTGLLARRCNGVWVYLRYVLNELRYGLRAPDQIGDLPADLRNYYADQIRRWRQDPAWQAGLLPLLATLSVAGEALPTRSLARLAGNPDRAAVQRWCDLTIRPMLTTTRAINARMPICYEIYHASFREFLSVQDAASSGSSGGQQSYELVALADELRHAGITAHNRICDTYLTCFGGLEGGVSVLAEDPGAAGIDGGYPLRYLAQHLCHAGRAAELRTLLAAEHPGAGGQLVNTWFAAHDQADSIISYLDDIARASSDAAATTGQYLTRGHAAPSLGLELRYALMAASIASYTANISTDLLGQLIRTGMWSSQRALDHARRIADPGRQVDALLAIRSEVNDQEQPAVLAQALTAATAITDDSVRARALAGLAPQLPAELLAQALTAATALADDYARGEALAGLAPQLPVELLAQALTAATAITDDSARAEALTGLAPQLPADQQPAVLAQALTAATAITDDYARGEALAGLAPQLSAELLAQALTAATAITNDYYRARALTGLAPQLPADQQPAVLAQALTTATAITDDDARARALTGLAPQLPADQQPAVLAQALTAATAITNNYSRAQALTGLAPQLPADQQPAVLAQALTTATAITDDDARGEALAGLAPQLPADQQPAVLAQALTAATAITNNYSRARALADLAPQLPAELLAQALTAATALAYDDARAQALTGLAPQLPAELLARALTAATALAEDSARAEALTGLAPQLSAELLAQALTAATAITKDSARARALTGLAPQLPADQQPAVLAQALTAATAITDESARARALAGLAAQLPADQQPAVLAQALTAATAITKDSARARALADLAPQLPAELLAQALTAATALSDDSARARALTGLAPQLPAELLAQALTAATAITDDSARARALTGLAPQLPAELLAQALTAATAITDDSARAEALTGLAPQLSAELLAQALTAATAITDDYYRAEALTGLAPQLAADQQPAVLAQALTTATAITDDDARARALTGLAPQLPADQQPAVLAQALTAATAITNDYARAYVLAGLAPQPARRPAGPGTHRRHRHHQRLRPRRSAGRAGAAAARRAAGPGTHRRHRHHQRLLPRPGADRAGAAAARRPAGPGTHRRHRHHQRLRPRPGADRAGAAAARRAAGPGTHHGHRHHRRLFPRPGADRAGAAPARRPAASRAGPGIHHGHRHHRRLFPRPGADRARAAPTRGAAGGGPKSDT